MNENILEIDSKIRQILNKANEPKSRPIMPTADNVSRWFATYLKASMAPKVVPYDFYLIEVLKLLIEYEVQLNTPRSVNFFRKIACPSIRQMNHTYRRYIEKVRALGVCDMSAPARVDEDALDTYKCSCSSPSFYMEDPDFYVCCKHCGQRTELNNVSVNYGDVKRLNISQKNPHDKKNHFSECIDRYQGKQKVVFPDGLLETIERALEAYNIIDPSKPERAQKYAKVKKDHIKLILKSLELYKQYKEDINVIYRLITGHALPKIDHLKRRLLEDFDTFDCRYNQLFSKVEKSAYHYYLILYELLCSYKVPCNKADFNFLKTAERKSQHDQKYKQVFESLGWNYTPFF